jgi:hypothetical protein
MRRPDPYGILEIGREAMRQWEDRALAILMSLGLYGDGELAPWYSLEDVLAPPPDRPYLSPGEVWEDQAPPPALPRAAVGGSASRDLIFE